MNDRILCFDIQLYSSILSLLKSLLHDHNVAVSMSMLIYRAVDLWRLDGSRVNDP